MDWTQDGMFSLENVQNSHTNIQGTEVENVWGFVMNYLNWGELKRRSNIYERFANVGMDVSRTLGIWASEAAFVSRGLISMLFLL